MKKIFNTICFIAAATVALQAQAYDVGDNGYPPYAVQGKYYAKHMTATPIKAEYSAINECSGYDSNTCRFKPTHAASFNGRDMRSYQYPGEGRVLNPYTGLYDFRGNKT